MPSVRRAFLYPGGWFVLLIQISFGHAKKYDIHGIKRHRDKKIKKYSKNTLQVPIFWVL